MDFLLAGTYSLAFMVLYLEYHSDVLTLRSCVLYQGVDLHVGALCAHVERCDVQRIVAHRLEVAIHMAGLHQPSLIVQSVVLVEVAAHGRQTAVERVVALYHYLVDTSFQVRCQSHAVGCVAASVLAYRLPVDTHHRALCSPHEVEKLLLARPLYAGAVVGRASIVTCTLSVDGVA